MADPVTRAFSASMRRLRAERGWSQRKLAEESGVARHTIERAEARATGPGLACAIAIAKALGTTADAMAREVPR